MKAEHDNDGNRPLGRVVSAHTPGPWEMASDRMDAPAPRATVIGGVEKTSFGTTRRMICHIYGWADGQEAEANARLITAAPELCEALRVAAACLEGVRRAMADDRIAEQQMPIIYAALEKAKVGANA